jgi:hypothetical protein
MNRLEEGFLRHTRPTSPSVGSQPALRNIWHFRGRLCPLPLWGMPFYVTHAHAPKRLAWVARWRSLRMLGAMRTNHLALLAATFIAVVPACSKGASAIASLGSDVVVDQLELGKVGLSIGADGSAKAAVESNDGKPLSKDAKGTLSFKSVSGEPKTVPLTFDTASGTLVAKGPKLEGDLTQVTYAIDVGGKVMDGSVHVPVGGTAQLVADGNAQATAAAPAVAADVLGPHGGSISVVGGDRFELVSDGSEHARIYLLGADGSIAPVEARTVTVGVVAEAPETVAFVAEPHGRYLTGNWHLHTDPARLTIASRANANAAAKVVLVGFKPGVALKVGAAAPHVKVITAAKLDDVDAQGKLAANADLKLQGNGNPIGTGMGKGNGNAQAGLNGALNGHGAADAKADAKANAGANAHAEVKGPSASVHVGTVGAPSANGKANGKANAAGGKAEGHLGASLNIH